MSDHLSSLPTDQLSPFLSESFSTSDYLHHILQAFTLGAGNATTGDKTTIASANGATSALPQTNITTDVSGGASSTQYALSLTSSALQKLSHSLSHTNTQIQHQLSSSWDTLTSRIAQIDELRSSHANLLREFHEMERIMQDRRHFNSDEYNQLEASIQEAHRLYAVVSTLRLMSRLHEWIREIDEGDLLAKDRVRCSRLVMNVLELYDERHELHGIHVVQESVQRMKRLQEQLKRDAQEQLMTAMKQRQHVAIAEALQIFYEMQTLRAEVTSLVAHAIQETKTVLQNALDATRGGSAGKNASSANTNASANSFTQRFTQHRGGRTSSGGGSFSSSFDMYSPEAKTEYLFRIKEMFAQVHSLYMDIWHLNRMLRKQKNPDTQQSFEQIVIRDEKVSIVENYWSSMTRIVTQEILSAMNNIQFVKAIFTQEYPQLLELFSDFAHKFTSYTEFLSRQHSGDASAKITTPTQWITDTMKDIQQEYLVKSVSRLNERINAIFSRVRAPKSLNDDNFSYMSTVDVRNFGNAIIMELQEAKKSTNLLHDLSKRVMSVLRQFSVLCEGILIHDEASFAVNPYTLPNVHQKFNAQIYNGLCTTHSLISEVIPEYNQHPAVQKDLETPLRAAEELAREIITPVFASLQKRMEEVLFSLHLESYTTADSSHEVSGYVKQLEQSLALLSKGHLKLYHKESAIFKSLSMNTAQRLIQYFVRQISLLNPLQEEGRIKLANDMAQVELAVGTNLFHVEKLGVVHRQLKAFRKLLFMETEAIVAGLDTLVREMDPLLIAQHLLSRVPPGPEGLVLRPHQYMNVNLPAYNQFIEDNEVNKREVICEVLRSFVTEEIEKLNTKRRAQEGKDGSEEYIKWVDEACQVLGTILNVLDRTQNVER